MVIHTAPNKLLVKPFYFISTLLGYKWKSQKYHINEQTISSFKKYFGFQDVNLTAIRVNEKNFYEKQLDNALLKVMGRILDVFIQLPILKNFLYTDFYFVVKLNKKS